MKIERLVEKCPECGKGLRFISAIDMPRIGDGHKSCGLTVPHDLIDEACDWHARYDECVNGHRINKRDYFDYDDHFIYESKVAVETQKLEDRLAALQRLKT